MPLIQCPECGGQVSDKASACPRCGHPVAGESAQPEPPPRIEVEPKKGTSWWKKALVVVLCGVCFFVVKAFVLGTKVVVREGVKKEMASRAESVSPEEAAKEVAEDLNAVLAEQVKNNSNTFVSAKAYSEGKIIRAVIVFKTNGLLPEDVIYKMGKGIKNSDYFVGSCSSEESKILFQYGISVHVLYKTDQGQFVKLMMIDKDECSDSVKKPKTCSESCDADFFSCSITYCNLDDKCIGACPSLKYCKSRCGH